MKELMKTSLLLNVQQCQLVFISQTVEYTPRYLRAARRSRTNFIVYSRVSDGAEYTAARQSAVRQPGVDAALHVRT